MVRGAAAPEAFTVGRILNEAQRSVAGHRKCAAALWRLASRQPAEVLEQLCACLRHVLPIGQVRTLCVSDICCLAAGGPSQPARISTSKLCMSTSRILRLLAVSKSPLYGKQREFAAANDELGICMESLMHSAA